MKACFNFHNRGWTILLLLIFHVALLGVFQGVSRFALDLNRKKWEGAAIESIQSFLAESHPKQIFLSAFKETYAHLAKSGRNPEMALPVANPFKRKIEGAFCLFNQQKKLIDLGWGKISSRYAYSVLWNYFTGTALTRTHQKLFKSLMGNAFSPQAVKNQPGILSLIHGDRGTGSLIWKKLPKGGGLLFHLPKIPGAFDTAKIHLRRSRAGNPLSLYFPAEKEWDLPPDAPEVWRTIFNVGLRQRGGTFACETMIHRLERHPEGFWIMQSGRIPEEKWWRNFQVISQAILLLSLVVCFFSLQMGCQEALSLLAKIVIVFLVCFTIPSLLLIFLEILSFQFETEKIQDNAHQKNIGRMQKVDLQFQEALDRYTDSFAHLAQSEGIRRSDHREIRQFLTREGGSGGFGIIQTHNLHGKVLFSSAGNSMFRQWIELMAKEILRHSLDAPIPLPGNEVERMVQNVILSPRLGLGWIFDHPGVPNNFILGPTGFTFLWAAFQPRPNEPTAFVCVSRYNHRLIADFLTQRLSPGVWAFNASNHTWFPAQPKAMPIRSLALQSSLARRPLKVVFPVAGNQYLISAYPSLLVSDHVFLTISSLTGPLQQAENEKRQLWGIMCVLLLLGGGMAFFTHQSFLVPIKWLSKGISLLVDRRFRKHVPDLGNDEMGILGREINHLFDEMNEVERAREVQQGFLPALQHDFEDFQIALYNSSATDLGGDYCDFISLSPSEKFYIVGDVTGHGISAALVTAMMKTTCHLVLQETKDLKTLLKKMSTVLFSGVNRQKKMTTHVGLLDLERGLLTWSNAGHLFPYYCRSNGEIEHEELIQPPPGFRKGIVWETQELHLQPGELFVVYTDGITETADPDGEFFGFDRLQKAISRHRHLAPQPFIQALIEEQRRFSKQTATDDDVTLLVLKRKEHATPG